MMNWVSLVEISSAEDMFLRELVFVFEKVRMDLEGASGCVCCGYSRVGMVQCAGIEKATRELKMYSNGVRRRQRERREKKQHRS